MEAPSLIEEARSGQANAFPWHELEAGHRTSVHLFSDDELFRAGCERLLSGVSGIALQSSSPALGKDWIARLAAGLGSDVLVVGVSTLQQETLDLVIDIHEGLPEAGIILVFGSASARILGDLRRVSTQVRHGFACVSRDSIVSTGHLTQLIDAVADGRILLDQTVMDRLFEPDGERNAVSDRVSKREAEVLDLMAQGLTNPGIAHALFLERKTVERHINSIYTKLDGQAPDGHPRVNTILAYLRASGRLDAA